jgi:uncharacterized membrane protein YkvA (DUF1232 family)
MKHSHLLIIREASGLSPEAFAARLGVSNMTVRRWMRKRPKGELPRLYAEALGRLVYELLAEGRLSETSPAVREVLAGTAPAAGSALGVPREAFGSPGSLDDENLAETLSRIGRDEQRSGAVERSWPRILSFKRLGKGWAERIDALRSVLASKAQLHERWIAYGSFFYLLCPLDLIADFTPAIGYVDDYMVLGAAVGFLMNRTKGGRK